MNVSKQYGDLMITLTSQYDMRYPDHGSGAGMDGTFWHPRGEGEYRPLGSICVGNYNDVNNNRASMLFANAPGSNALAAPVDYAWVWDDSGSGADWDGSVWRPIAPNGYLALGDVATANHDKPSLGDVWCVRADLVTNGVFAGDKAWQDAGSGGDHDIAAWPVEVGDPSRDPQMGVFAPDTFIAVASYDGAPNMGLAMVVQVPITAEVGAAPVRPSLEGRTPPTDHTPPVRDRSVVLPFTALFDRTDRPSLDKIANPFCTIERWVGWSLVLFDDNTTSAAQTTSKATTVGVTTTESEAFAHSVGIKLGWETGAITKYKVELNYQFTYTTSSSTANLQSATVTRSLSTPAGVAAGLWTATYKFRVIRADGAVIGRELMFDVDSVAHDQYPPVAPGVSKALAMAG
ncbi:MAG: Vps62-related protein [Novosphingobium sp.]|uniref:Vps62-related protein n=1 Tax=Novosphingobium sp. TaxID=1874826 RepID=UPI003B997AA3